MPWIREVWRHSLLKSGGWKCGRRLSFGKKRGYRKMIWAGRFMQSSLHHLRFLIDHAFMWTDVDESRYNAKKMSWLFTFTLQCMEVPITCQHSDRLAWMPRRARMPRRTLPKLQRRSYFSAFLDNRLSRLKWTRDNLLFLLQQNKKRRRPREICHVFNF